MVRYKDDAFMKVKLSIIKDLAAMLNFILKLFPTLAPMFPFLLNVLEKLLRCFLLFFTWRKAVVNTAVTSYQLIKINIDESCKSFTQTDPNGKLGQLLFLNWFWLILGWRLICCQPILCKTCPIWILGSVAHVQ